MWHENAAHVKNAKWLNEQKCIFYRIRCRSLISELVGISESIHDAQTAVYEEIDVPVKDVDLKIAKELFSRKPETEFRIVSKRPINIKVVEKERNGGVKKSFRATDFKFRADGKFLAGRCDALPTTIFVFAVSDLSLDSVIVHRFPVVCITWGPVAPYSECLTTLTSGTIIVFYALL